MPEEQLTPKLPEDAPLADRIARIERLETELLRKAAALMEKDSGISHSDMFVIGAIFLPPDITNTTRIIRFLSPRAREPRCAKRHSHPTRLA